MKIPPRYSQIFSTARNLGLKDKQTWKLISVFKDEYVGEPSSFGDLLEAVE